MKAAVISAVPTCGKTTFIEVLGSVYSRSQGRDVVVFTTGDAKDNLEQITNLTGSEALDNPHVFRAMVQNSGEDAKELLNYGVQAGDEHVYIYNILGASMAQNEKEEFLLEAIDTVPADLTLIEIHGDVNSELNTAVMSKCDCCLLLTEQSPRGFREAKKLMNLFTVPNMKYNRALVVSKYDPIVSSDKKMAEQLGISVQSIYKFPRNSVLAKMAYNGELDQAAYNIITGDYELVQFRTPLLEVMRFLFDTDKRKIIRGVDKWYK
jgi:hypothetical protein